MGGAAAVLNFNFFEMSKEKMSAKQIGKVVQCIGAVVDVEFPRDSMPKVFDALKIDTKIQMLKQLKKA